MAGEASLIDAILQRSSRIAVVGCSTNPAKDAHRVPKYLQSVGYTVIPVHPSADRILGEKAYRSLADVPGTIDLVNVFRPSGETPAVVEAAIAAGAPAVWLQLGISSAAARRLATAARLDYIEDRCIMVEHRARTRATPGRVPPVPRS